MTNANNAPPAEQEAEERQLAELEFIKSAYTPEEAWTEATANNNKTKHCVFRRLKLPINADTSAEVEILLQMPKLYPVCPSAALEIKGNIVSCPSNPSHARKAALDSLPNLIEACRTTAAEIAEVQEGGEAVWPVLSRVEEWVENEWKIILSNNLLNVDETPKNTIISNTNKDLILGRRLVYSHHIIANSKRKKISSLASQYNLGGFAKIGWPGILVIEGNECDCQIFIDEIRSMRWQHLEVRWEEQHKVQKGKTLDDYRKLPTKFEDLGKDQMSLLAQLCREAGLENLFLEGMKINDQRNLVSEDKPLENEPMKENDVNQFTYGALVHIDHMNDAKRYRDWLWKESRSSGCRLILKQCHHVNSKQFREKETKNTSNLYRQQKKPSPTIIVGIFGDEDGVKRFLKQWRISRVDVDSKNKPCLERMMTVIRDGKMTGQVRDRRPEKREVVLSQFFDGESDTNCSFSDLDDLLSALGTDWAHCFRKFTGYDN